ncbi:MAG: ATP-binding cassette domain-containing protein [Pseudomonadota bacterium]
MLILKNIHRTINKNTLLAHEVLKGVDLTVAPGEFVVLIGGNGSGKSTLLNIIAGQVAPDCGQITIDQHDVTHVPQHQRACTVATVMQDPKVGTMEQLTLFENLAFAAQRGKQRGLGLYQTTKRRQHFQEHLALLGMGLENRLDDCVAHLSGGQRQALSLIMAILAPSKILLLDEITAALDPKIAESVVKIAAQLVTQYKQTTLMITHNMAHAIHYGDRTVLLAQGKIAKQFTGQDKIKLTPSMLTAEFE